jgi:predicted dehydrogenase
VSSSNGLEPDRAAAADTRLPRIGALGLGWIGRKRLEAVQSSSSAEIVALCDVNPAALEQALALAPGARSVDSYDALLELDLDAIVIATPSALHARQCVQALERGHAVFCQKPLARTLAETESVLEAARAADRLLGVDFCYRETRALSQARETVRSGEIGRVYAVDLVFHNAYGPDAGWAYEPALSGGGCLMDLGVHLVDAALFVLGEVELQQASARLFKAGQRVLDPSAAVEDFANARLDLANGTSIDLSCSWRSSFGEDARIVAEFFGTRGGVRFANVGGSFYDFCCDVHRENQRQRVVSPPDDWGGRAINSFLHELRRSKSFRPVPDFARVAEMMDAMYGRGPAKRAQRTAVLPAERRPEQTP